MHFVIHYRIYVLKNVPLKCYLGLRPQAFTLPLKLSDQQYAGPHSKHQQYLHCKGRASLAELFKISSSTVVYIFPDLSRICGFQKIFNTFLLYYLDKCSEIHAFSRFWNEKNSTTD